MLQKYNFLLSQNESQCKISAFFSKKQILIAKNGKKLALFGVRDSKGCNDYKVIKDSKVFKVLGDSKDSKDDVRNTANR